jgi:hypothetical protein
MFLTTAVGLSNNVSGNSGNYLLVRVMRGRSVEVRVAAGDDSEGELDDRAGLLVQLSREADVQGGVDREDPELQHEVQDDLPERCSLVDRVDDHGLGAGVLGGDVAVAAGDFGEAGRGGIVQDVLAEAGLVVTELHPHVDVSGANLVVGVHVGCDVLRDVRVVRGQHAAERIEPTDVEARTLVVRVHLQVAVVQADAPVAVDDFLDIQGSRADHVADLLAGDDLRRLDERHDVVDGQQLELRLVVHRLRDAERQVCGAHDLQVLVLLALRQVEHDAHAVLLGEAGAHASPSVVPEQVADGPDGVIEVLRTVGEVFRQEDGGVGRLVVGARVGTADEVQAKLFDGSHNPLSPLICRHMAKV